MPVWLTQITFKQESIPVDAYRSLFWFRGDTPPQAKHPLKDNTPQGPHPTCEQNDSQTGVKT